MYFAHYAVFVHNIAIICSEGFFGPYYNNYESIYLIRLQHVTFKSLGVFGITKKRLI